MLVVELQEELRVLQLRPVLVLLVRTGADGHSCSRLLVKGGGGGAGGVGKYGLGKQPAIRYNGGRGSYNPGDTSFTGQEILQDKDPTSGYNVIPGGASGAKAAPLNGLPTVFGHPRVHDLLEILEP